MSSQFGFNDEDEFNRLKNLYSSFDTYSDFGQAVTYSPECNLVTRFATKYKRTKGFRLDWSESWQDGWEHIYHNTALYDGTGHIRLNDIWGFEKELGNLIEPSSIAGILSAVAGASMRISLLVPSLLFMNIEIFGLLSDLHHLRLTRVNEKFRVFTFESELDIYFIFIEDDFLVRKIEITPKLGNRKNQIPFKHIYQFENIILNSPVDDRNFNAC